MKVQDFKKVGTAVIIEGSKAVALGAALTVAGTFMTKGTAGVKELDLDTLLTTRKRKGK